MAAEADEPKWEGKATVKLRKPTAQQVWPLLEDFCSFHNWLPSIDTCREVEGAQAHGHGLVRYCAATLPPPPDGGEGVVKWCHEKLVSMDPTHMWLSYEVLENNMGFKSYKSTIKVSPIEGGDDDDLNGCQIEWSFLADPVEGLTCDDLLNYVDISLQGMAQNMEKALESSN
ncbi:hypothetical protein Salat_2406100 [Sesamum alatum]|uniref:Lachrymatory-factor synthase n=1 Tax=Sesamum alatum TaxID=300844 RepID=A0AAE1XXU0_9LAMI|nr:hypothetical protein Salat_2406100 [Sesamum alatum]